MTVVQTITPVMPFVAVEQVTDAQLARYADLIHTRTGIRVLPQKKILLSNRLRRRLRATGVQDFEQYYQLLKKLPPRDPEWDAFLQEVTTHETYLFRDKAHWEWFRNSYLRECAANARNASSVSLRIWSAACSTGDEAATVACCVAACLPDYQRWQVRIVGTDIGIGAVEQAKDSVFGQRAMHLVPEDYRRRFFTKSKDGDLWQARPSISEMLTFRQHNLLEPLYEKPFDLILLKNVLIYFSQQSKATVLRNIRTSLKPGGLLLVGAAEGVADLLRDFHRIEPWLYRKPVA